MPIVATPQPDNLPPRVQLDVTGVTGDQATITRLDPDGRTRPIRTAEPATLTGGTWTGFDYEAPFGALTTYNVIPASGTDTATSNTVTLDSTKVWLIHGSIPDLSVGLHPYAVELLDARRRAARSAVMQPLGRTTPITVSEVRSSVTSSLNVITDISSELNAITALLDSGVPVLLNAPPSLGWALTYEWAAIGDTTEEALTRGITPATRVALPYTVVDRPAGSLLAQWTYADVVATYATYGDVLAAYSTYSDLLANNT